MQDDDERFRFIDLVVSPLGKTAEAELARGELMSRVMHAEPAAGDDSLAETTDRLEKAGASRHWFAAFSIAALFLLTGILFPVLKAAMQEVARLNSLYHFDSSGRNWTFEDERRITAGLSREEKIFLLANSKDVFDTEVLDWLKDASMESPGEFLEEIVTPGLEGRLPLVQSLFTGKLQPESKRFSSLQELMERAVELEPDNGRWQLEAARSVYGRGAEWSSTAKRTVIRIPDHFWEAVKQLEAAANQPRIESRLGADTQRRLRMIGPVETVADQAQQVHFLSSQRERIPYDHALHAVWIARGEELAEHKDPEAWKAWVQRWVKIETALPPWAKTQTEIAEVERLANTALAFAGQAKALGLTSEAERLARMALHAASVVRYLNADEQKAVATLAGADHRRMLVAAEDLAAYTPGRKAEYALADRAIALGGALVFVLLGGLAFLEGWRRLPAQRGLAAGLMPLFGRRDFAWLAGLGILLPLLWHIIIGRFTPLGWRDAGLSAWSGPSFFVQAGATLLFAWCMLLQTARWRIAKRAGLVGLRSGGAWVGWLAAAVAALCVPTVGLVRYVPRKEEFFLATSAALGLPLLWVIWRAGLAIFQPRESALGGVIACRLLLPMFTAAAALCLLLMIPLRAEEKKWVAQDHLGGPDPAGSLLQEIEARGLESLRVKLREAWEAP